MPERRDEEERTEQATPKKRREALEKGNVAKSRELPSALLLLITTLFFYFYITNILEVMKDFFFETWQTYRFNIDTDSIYYIFNYFLLKALIVFLPFIFIIILTAFLSNVVQFGFIFSAKALEPKWERLNPINGFKNLFSKRSLVELGKSLFKIFVVGAVAYYILKGKIDDIASLTNADINFTLLYLGKLIFKIFLYIALVILVLAAMDFAYQKWQHERDLMMSKREVKEELRQMEGDPLIRQRIRSLQREMARRRMMEEVPKADVVITNPTHYAIALKYDSRGDNAPKIVAKGQNLIALRIKEIAKNNNVPVYEDPNLARLLFDSVDIGSEIPENLYKAVAEVLAFVYNLNRRMV
ncbi:MAG: flagellar biosynthesis protein FlhB [Deferribacterota bacterium]|nr:flagellar biosynthesis protein FlhB [Deferribacterota bacterium]